MGLFRKKKTTEELFEQGKYMYNQNDYTKAALSFSKINGDTTGEVDFWIAKCYLAMNGKKPNEYNLKFAKRHLQDAADKGHQEAKRLLEEYFDIYFTSDTVLSSVSSVGLESEKGRESEVDLEGEETLELVDELDRVFDAPPARAEKPTPKVQSIPVAKPASAVQSAPEEKPKSALKSNQVSAQAEKSKKENKPEDTLPIKLHKPGGREFFERSTFHANIGVLGHMGHGKTVLTAAIMKVMNARVGSCEFSPDGLDRHPREKEQSMTMAGNLVEISTKRNHYAFIDCPGHADFVRTATSKIVQMDGAILVVSAQEGVMMQTREHVILARQFGVSHMVVFLNKSDTIDDENLLEAVRLSVLDLLKEYDYPTDTPFIYGSAERALKEPWSEWGEQIQNLMDMVDQYIPMPVRDRELPFLMPVDQIYYRNDSVIVTGRVERGKLELGDEVEIAGLGHDQKGVAVDIEIFHKYADDACAGDMIGIAIGGVKASEIKKGQVLIAPGSSVCHRVFSAKIQLLPREDNRYTSVHNGYCPMFYFRTAVVGGECTLPENKRFLMAFGSSVDSGEISVRLTKPVLLEKGQKFVIRDDGWTIGLGEVLGIVE